MANTRSTNPRRREVRRTVGRPGPAWLVFLRRRDVMWAIAFIAMFTLIGGALVWIGQTPRYYRGQIASDPIVTRHQFTHINQELTAQKKQEAFNKHPRVYVPNLGLLESLKNEFQALTVLMDYESVEQVPADQRTRNKLTPQALGALRAYAEKEDGLKQWETDRDAFLQKIYSLAILTERDYDEERAASAVNKIIVENPLPATGQNAHQDLYASVFYDISARTPLTQRIEQFASEHFPAALRPMIVEITLRDLQPTYFYDDQLTQAAKRQAYEREPDKQTTHAPNTVLVPRGTELESDDLELLSQEHAAFIDRQSVPHRLALFAVRSALVLLIGLGLWAYIFAYNPRIVRNPMRGFALTTLLLLCQGLAVGLTQWQPESLYATAVFPTLLATVTLTIVYDQRFAVAVGAFHTMLVMLSLDLPIEFGMVLLTGVGAAIAQLREVRTRSKLVMVGLWSGVAMGVTTLLTSLATRDLFIVGEFQRILTHDTLLAVLTGVGVGLLVQGMLPGIERIFKVTTAMTLRELNDASHPLLQRLAQEASGTYQHSLRIADMAEAAADSIAADGLLCRVGAMYHDIGKINKPQYFIENQGGGPNRHSKLSPAMSLLIIVGHVKDGIEMAREYGLPPVIRHFIESHHGTTLVEYFYHAAKRAKEAADEDVPSEFEFRYPGPKPQTREAAIMLLCDSIEAAARSLAEPTPIRLEQLVHTMANKRLMDGQFDECNLTLQELHRIEQAITKTLCAVYHSRIKYPTDRPEEQQPPPQAAASAPGSRETTPPREPQPA